MSKNVYIDYFADGRPYVREILPDAAVPIAEWYNEEFASHCVEAPDDIKQNMLYDEKAKEFYEYCSLEEDDRFVDNSIGKQVKDVIDRI